MSTQLTLTRSTEHVVACELSVIMDAATSAGLFPNLNPSSGEIVAELQATLDGRLAALPERAELDRLEKLLSEATAEADRLGSESAALESAVRERLASGSTPSDKQWTASEKAKTAADRAAKTVEALEQSVEDARQSFELAAANAYDAFQTAEVQSADGRSATATAELEALIVKLLPAIVAEDARRRLVRNIDSPYRKPAPAPQVNPNAGRQPRRKGWFDEAGPNMGDVSATWRTSADECQAEAARLNESMRLAASQK